LPRAEAGAFIRYVQTQATNGASRSEEMVSVGDVRLHVVSQGSGPPVLLLHGFPEFWYSYRHQMQALADAGFRAIAPDLRGYNLSDKPKGIAAYGIEKLADDVEGLIRALGHDRVHLVGHDWGGYLAWYVAAHRPHLVSRLVVLNGPHPKIMARELLTPGQLAMSWYMFFFQLPVVPEKVVAKRESLERILRGWSPAAKTAFSDADIDAFTEAMQRPGAARAALNWYRAALRSPLRSLRTPKIQAPTLVVWGELDRCLGLGQLRGLEREVRHLTVVRLPDAGHFVQQERAEEVSARIVDFLKDATVDVPRAV